MGEKLNHHSARTLLAFVILLAESSLIYGEPQGRGRVLPVDEMVRQADVVGVATVRSATPREEPRNGLICTDIRLEFSEVWKGDPGREFILVKPGGQIGEEKTTVPGHEYALSPGESVVVFGSPSKLGNHNVIGIRQGLYRIGPGSEKPLFRVSEHPWGAGKTSILTLKALKDDVWRALGRPVEPEPEPAPTRPALPPSDRPSEHGAAWPPAPSTPAAPVPPPPSEGSHGGAWLVLALIPVIGLTVLIFRKKRSTNP
jgi:hypothetical protein